MVHILEAELVPNKLNYKIEKLILKFGQTTGKALRQVLSLTEA
jgi:hypothetical protein